MGLRQDRHLTVRAPQLTSAGLPVPIPLVDGASILTEFKVLHAVLSVLGKVLSGHSKFSHV